MSEKDSMDYLIEEIERNKDKIPQNYKGFYKTYLRNLEKQKLISRKKGDRKFIVGNFKESLMELISKKGFKVEEEVDLYNPKKKVPFLGNLVKDTFSDFKKSKKIDLIAYKDNEQKKIIFIEIKMKITTSFMLPGLFELGLIDGEKIPKDYEFYLILLSGSSRKAEKYEKIFNILRNIFIEKNMRNRCKFVLLDPKGFINEDKFFNEILA